jgi:uncharacterized protein YutE (UPF0331/DUF86 family)
MIDKNLMIAKAAKVDEHLKRIKMKRSVKLEEFLGDLDRQESILFNLQMSLQNCIDIAAHIISDDELGVAGSTNEMFYVLQENGYLTAELTEKMVAAVGLRNLVVHEYGKIDLTKVYQNAHQNIDDLEEYLRAIFRKCGMAQTIS